MDVTSTRTKQDRRVECYELNKGLHSKCKTVTFTKIQLALIVQWSTVSQTKRQPTHCSKAHSSTIIGCLKERTLLLCCIVSLQLMILSFMRIWHLKAVMGSTLLTRQSVFWTLNVIPKILRISSGTLKAQRPQLQLTHRVFVWQWVKMQLWISKTHYLRI